jgi:threonine/homoserine/homoserine lactone efflux protein
MAVSLIEGIILGVTLAFIIGPAFISLIQTSIHRGLRSGLLFALGIALSDLTLVALSYLGAMQFLDDADNQFYVGIIGGAILIAFGLFTFLKKYKSSNSNEHNHNGRKGIEVRVSITGGGEIKHVLKGFFLNILNPFLLIFWIGVMSFVSAKYGVGTKQVVFFFAGAIGAVFITDTIKCFIANHIRKYLNFTILKWVNRSVGLALVIFGVVMFIRVFIYL